MRDRRGDDLGGAAGVVTTSEFGVDPDLGAVLYVPVGDGVHRGDECEVRVDGDVTDSAVDSEHQIGRDPAFGGAFEHAIAAT